jgi:hypothetical protein
MATPLLAPAGPCGSPPPRTERPPKGGALLENSGDERVQSHRVVVAVFAGRPDRNSLEAGKVSAGRTGNVFGVQNGLCVP